MSSSSRMRASFWVIAPLVARMGEARVSLPGGCAIGTRPVDLLLMALEKLGATIEIDAGYAVARAPRGLTGAEIVFPKVTVGGTHTALMGAATAHGSTLIRNAAREPEVRDLADCLVKMGARIKGAGTSEIEVEGVARLNGARHHVLPDRIEAGTYATAVAMTGGDILLEGVRQDLFQEALGAIERAGASVSSDNRGVRVTRNGAGIAPVDISTAAVPRLPHRPAGAVHGADDARQGAIAHHRDHLRESLHARAGARPPGRADKARGDSAIVDGVDRLRGAPVMATDLRASVSLVIAALAAEGETTVNRVYHLDRGFERLEQKLSACGADIERVAG